MHCNFLAYFASIDNRIKIANKLASYQGNTFPFVEPEDVINRLSGTKSKVPVRFEGAFDLEKWIWACCIKILRQYKAEFYTHQNLTKSIIPVYGLGLDWQRDEDSVDRTYVTDAVEKLPSLERDIIYSHTYNNESFRSIGRRHNLPHYTIIHLHQKALLVLKSLLENETHSQ